MGTKVLLVRENNKYDPNAIAIFYALSDIGLNSYNWHHIGYISKYDNKQLLPYFQKNNNNVIVLDAEKYDNFHIKIPKNIQFRELK